MASKRSRHRKVFARRPARNRGGQTSHPGSNLKKMEPTRIEPLMPSKCAGCPHYQLPARMYSVMNRVLIARQVVDVDVAPKVTEYRQAICTGLSYAS